jgi:hypothetical protein
MAGGTGFIAGAQGITFASTYTSLKVPQPSPAWSFISPSRHFLLTKAKSQLAQAGCDAFTLDRIGGYSAIIITSRQIPLRQTPLRGTSSRRKRACLPPRNFGPGAQIWHP